MKYLLNLFREIRSPDLDIELKEGDQRSANARENEWT